MAKIYSILLLLIFLGHPVSAKKEKVLYDINYAFGKRGEVLLVISDTIFNGKPAIHYYGIGRTIGLADKLFSITDIYETTVDAETFLPLKTIRNIKEGKYRWYNETLFYHEIDSINSQRSGWKKSPEGLLDFVSAFFYFMNGNLKEESVSGSLIKLPTFHGDKISETTIKYLGETKVKTDLGDVDTYILSPVVDKGKLLKRDDAVKLFILKENNIPVLLDFDLVIGNLKALLRSYKIDNVEQIQPK